MPFFLLLLLCVVMPATAQTQWFDRHSEGWFWYEPVEDSDAEQEDTRLPSATVMSPPLSTAWLRNNIGQYLDKAIDDPSKENVSAYLYLNKIVKDKAERFAHAGKRVIESNPYLDENVRRPISPAAAKLKDDMAYKAKESILAKIAKTAGLVFYYRGGCPLCHVQAKTILLLQATYGFEIIPVSTDGGMIQGLPDSRFDPAPSSELNIISYPALFLMQPPNNIQLVRQGTISFTELVDRLVEVAYEQSWINEQDYLATKIAGAEPQPSYRSFNDELPGSLLKVLNHEQ